MKKIVIAVAVLAWSGLAVAGEYHNYDSLKCSQCHTMHASRQHELNSAKEDQGYLIANQGNPKPSLLLAGSVNETCLSCHDGAKGPDVFGSAASAGLRSAGALNGTVVGHTLGTAGDVAATAYADWMGHTMGAKVVPPGYTGTGNWATEEFECSDCHSVHGSTAFRNLGKRGRAIAAVSPVISYQMGGAFDPAYDVNIATVGNSDATADITFGNGGVANFKGAATTPTNNMNVFCAGCHGNFHGEVNGVNRHPVGDLAGTMSTTGTIGADALKLVRPIFLDAGKASFAVSCLTCHKGHGNARGYGLVYPGVTPATVMNTKDTSAPVTDYEQGDALGTTRGYPIRNLCITCHSQGRTKR
jgi:hypothetical protein